MTARLAIAVLAAVLVLAVPGSALAQLAQTAPQQGGGGLSTQPPSAGGGDSGGSSGADDSSPGGSSDSDSSSDAGSGASADDAGDRGSATTDRDLPRTGTDPRLLLLAGMALTFIGVGLRLRTADADLY